MQKVDIVDMLQNSIENVLYKAWHHEGYIDCFNSTQVTFVVDGKRYVLELTESDQ